jgi:hypothetical protein
MTFDPVPKAGKGFRPPLPSNLRRTALAMMIKRNR